MFGRNRILIACASAAIAIAGAASAAVSYVCRASDFITERIEHTAAAFALFVAALFAAAFPPQAPALAIAGLAAAPRVSGLHPTRAFLSRLRQWGDSACRSGPSLSTALSPI